ncbi:actin-binding protein WASF2-like [Saccostrea echinata]|uniref:actin-binding protein WASF2-like n=1 Tax=Saccostrea echinata TaxID=191078 RepID=UPI002A81B24C|nr:actin-binding protein WASF2-like [Saccostrea echinata]
MSLPLNFKNFRLSSLSKHAEDLFTELSQEVQTFTDRTRQFQRRINHIQEKVSRMEVAEERGRMKYPSTVKSKSSTRHLQQVVSRSTIPRCILEAYSQCEAKPALVDGEDSLKFYINPSYFIELWLMDIQKDRPKKVVLRKTTPRHLRNIAQRNEKRKHGVEFLLDYADSDQTNTQNNQPTPEHLDVPAKSHDYHSNDHSGPGNPLTEPQYSHDKIEGYKILIEKPISNVSVRTTLEIIGVSKQSQQPSSGQNFSSPTDTPTFKYKAKFTSSTPIIYGPRGSSPSNSTTAYAND